MEMKALIDKSYEAVYVFEKDESPFTVEADFDPSYLARYEKARTEWEAIQKELCKLYNE
jgi:hypothetical protein